VPAAAIVIGLGFVAATSLVIIVSGRAMPWREDQKPRQDIRVRHPFSELDDQRTAEARDQARQSTPNHYKLNGTFLQQIKQDLTNLYNDLKAAAEYSSLPEAKRKSLKEQWGIDQGNFKALRDQVATAGPEQFQAKLKELISFLIASNIIEVMPEEYRKATSIIFSGRPGRGPLEVRQWTFANDKEKLARLGDEAGRIFARPLAAVVQRYLVSNFQPIWLFDRAETDRHRQRRYDSDQNLRYRNYAEGQILVGANQKIGTRELELLRLEHDAYWASLSRQAKFLAHTGVVVIVFLITVAVGIYCVKFEFRAIHNWTRSLALALTTFSMVVLALVLPFAGLNDYAAAFEVVFIASVMTIAYNQRFAMMSTVVLTCLLVMGLNGNVHLLLALLAGGVTVVFTLNEVRRRSKLIEVAGASGLMTFVVVWAVQLADYQDLRYILTNAGWAAVAALVAGFIVQGILPVIERLFRIATSMTLLEWCDVSKPLLRRLALEVPGTFSHSQLIGSMAESAAEAIGANGLLARVGAYYHDIGKINKSEYFVENQPNLEMTRHKNLSPAMSLLIIIGHVKDGIDLAKEYGLPKVLHQFIEEHHGTTLVEYFFHRASEKSESEGKAVSDVEFRYPGPKPHTKESAILMLADSVEGATRALSEPTPGRIEAQVHQVVKKKLEDGQFDECDLTLRELHQIEDSLTRSLWAIYHGRLAYPSQERPVSGPPSQVTKLATGA